jgi:hypothetical protein
MPGLALFPSSRRLPAVQVGILHGMSNAGCELSLLCLVLLLNPEASAPATLLPGLCPGNLPAQLCILLSLPAGTSLAASRMAVPVTGYACDQYHSGLL